jgi:hypothetical protein
MSRRHAVLLIVALVAASFASAATRTWTGAVDATWSTPGNWSGGAAPVDGDALVFPGGAANTTNVNDIAGLDLLSVAFTGGTYSASGNAVTLSGGMTNAATAAWNVPVTLTASQTFENDLSLTLASSINLNGQTLTLDAISLFTGTITGSGAVELIGAMEHSGTSSFTGTFTLVPPPLQGPNLHLPAAGTITSATLQGRGTLSGRGTVSTTTLTDSIVAPGGIGGTGTGILTTGTLALTGGTVSLHINGTVPGTNYDRIAVNGTVTLGSPTLEILLPGVLPSAGQSFIIIANDGTADPVSGTFAGLPEGSTFAASGVTFQITYAGGDGNDVVLTVPAAGGPKVWTGAVNNLWSVGGNWSGGVAPVDGDDLIFPDTAANRTMTNDLTGLDLGFVRFTGDTYNAGGNAVTLAEGLYTDSTITWSIPATLTASQTFVNDGGALTVAGSIQLNGQTLTFDEGGVLLSGSLSGSGNVVLSGVGFEHSGMSTFTGTFTLQDLSHLNVPASGAITAAPVQGDGVVSGRGMLAAIALNGGAVAPGPSPFGACCSNLPGRLSTGSLTLDPGGLMVDLNGPLPDVNYDQVAVTGTVTLDQTPLQVFLGVAPAPGQSFIIISNDGTDPVRGTFVAQPEGQVFVAGGTAFRVSYVGGDGNDVVLYAVAPTTTTLESSENPTTAGDPITLTATVTSGIGTPTGTVTFFGSGGAVLGSVPVGPAGTASITITLPAGTHPIAASFDGTGPFNDSDSATLNQVVEPAVDIPTLGGTALLLCAIALGLAGAFALRS